MTLGLFLFLVLVAGWLVMTCILLERIPRHCGWRDPEWRGPALLIILGMLAVCAALPLTHPTP